MSSAHLLVVDDEPDMGLIFKALGKRFDWKVDHRLDAGTAWVFLQQAEPDLVLLDVRMPGMGGPDLCRRLRADSRCAELRLALFTHAGVPEDVADGLAAGAPYLLNKELICRAEACQQRVAEILAAPRGRGVVRPVTCPPGFFPPELEDGSAASLPAALRQPVLRSMAPPILRALVRQALRQAFGPTAAGNDSLENWLLGERGGNHSKCAPPQLHRQAIVLLAVCLAEQVWCLLGDAASASVRAALVSSAPGLTEGSTCR